MAEIAKPADASKFNAAFKKTSEEELVSSNVIKTSALRAKSIRVEDILIKLLTWYDNERGIPVALWTLSRC